MLIFAVMPFMSIYWLPLGQYDYSGHVVNFPQDVRSFARSLPRLPSEIDVLVIRRDYEHTHKDFRVRRAVVGDALMYLLENNKYYQGNTIQLNQEALQQLPVDGNVMDVRSLHVPDAEDQPMAPEEDHYDAHLSTLFVPNAAQRSTEQEAVQHTVRNLQTGSYHTLMWPTIGGAAINEYTTEGYMTMAFPTLFPTGAADFLGLRTNEVTIGNYFTHLMKYKDGRFAKHPRFRFFALNTEMRHRALSAGRVYIRQHPGKYMYMFFTQLTIHVHVLHANNTYIYVYR